jgi:hypothetical protein
MNERSIVLYLHLKGLLTHAIHDDIVATLVPNAVAYSTVARYLRKAKLGTDEVTLDPESRSPHLISPRRFGPGSLGSLGRRRKVVSVRARTYLSHPYPTRYRL